MEKTYSNGDPYITGALVVADSGKCDVCRRPVKFWLDDITIANLPAGISRYATIAAYANTIGVECGCYSKFHRQVAHIEDSVNA